MRTGAEKASLILASNQSFVVDSGEIFSDQALATAILDQLLHHNQVVNINGRGYRLRDLEQAVSLRARPMNHGRHHDNCTKLSVA